MPSPNPTPNRLINEKSPYLLQHAYNPVDWYPWCDEAFAKAKAEDKPVFLSIGYSTCHWCHVMERESFEDAQVARLLNRDFVPVKVDREERADIDSVYMAVCQAVTGSGGWPLTIVMSPDQNPFFAATYLPKTARYNMAGLLELLPEIARQWKSNRPGLLQTSEEIRSFLQRRSAETRPGEPSRELILQGMRQLRAGFDDVSGGFSGAPKFPTPHNLLFLLRLFELEGDQSALDMVEKTLSQMYRGGIFDHIGGGFSRYSTDNRWLVPHFEKMLYDNALLAYVYLETYRVTKRPLYRAVAEQTLDYALRELFDEAGGFYCGQDADSDGVEGKYYVFTPQEICQVLGDERGEAFCRWFCITPKGHLEGKSIPNLLCNDRFEDSDAQIRQSLKPLYDYRLRRAALHKDDKILTSWNALMLAALAQAARVLQQPCYLQAAQGIRRFIRRHLSDGDGRLFVRWRDGDAAVSGQLDDYAFYAWALLELYRCTFEADCLEEAIQILQRMIDLFFDGDNGGFFIYAGDAEELILRPKDTYDGAIPSGNAVAGLVLGRIARLTAEPQWQQYSDRQLSFLAGEMKGYPAAHTFSLLAMLEAVYPSLELVCVTRENGLPPDLVKLLEQPGIPNLTVLAGNPDNREVLSRVAPFTDNYAPPSDGAAYYLCRNGACLPPVYDIESLSRLLQP